MKKSTNANEIAHEFIERSSGGIGGGMSDTYPIDVMIAKSIVSLDKFFGVGFAQKNPNLLAASISAAARLESVRFGNIEDAMNAIANGLCELAAAKQK
jgi:hypothetical protein